MDFDRNSDYPGDYNETPRDPIPFDRNINPGGCTRVAIAGVSSDRRTIWIRPPGFDNQDDDEEDGHDDMDTDDDDDDNEEEWKDPPDVLVIKEGGEEGYWIGRVLEEAICGLVRYAAVVRKRANTENNALIGWDKTGEECVVKEMPHWKIRYFQTRSMEDPIKEVAAMQYLRRWCNQQQQGNDDAHLSATMEQFHIILPRDVLSDDKYLYNVMPYLNGGEFLVQLGGERLNEHDARYWFRQMLIGLGTLQRAHICHHDISPENIMVHNSGLLIIDMGMCLRIPYEDDDNNNNNNNNNDTNNNEGTQIPPRRYLIRSERRYGKRRYMSREVFKSQNYDGHAIDLWAVGVILYVMLMGDFPWEVPSISQRLFPVITGGYLLDMFQSWGVTPQHLSPDAVDLLQRMLFRNPRDRLSLEQVWAHPWVANE